MYFCYMKFLEKIFGKKSLRSIARNTGYVKDQLGIQNRYIRENGGWNSHLDNTKKYILDSMDYARGKKNVAVLGSGWLLDVPIEELASNFGQVHLYDIVHPEQIVVKMKKFPNVHLFSVDLTGGVVELAQSSSSFSDFMSCMKQRFPDFHFEQYDLVISVNLLNQLDIILCDYLSDKFHVNAEQLTLVRKTVQQNHVDCLPKGKTCLVTDFQEENISILDAKVQTKQLLYCSMPNSAHEKEWNWMFDSNQMYHKGQNTVLKVKAMRF